MKTVFNIVLVLCAAALIYICYTSIMGPINFENAKKEANTILENATNEAQAEYESKMLKKQSESQAKLKTFRLDLQEQKKALETEIVAHLPEFEMALQNKIQQL